MTEEEKKKECERLCGPIFSKESGLHVMAPVMCPIQRDIWLNMKRAPSPLG